MSKTNERYLRFVTDMAKLSSRVPRIKPPKLLNYNLFVKSPFPDNRPGSSERHALTIADIKRRTDFYNAAIHSNRPLKPLDLGDALEWTDDGNEMADDALETKKDAKESSSEIPELFQKVLEESAIKPRDELKEELTAAVAELTTEANPPTSTGESTDLPSTPSLLVDQSFVDDIPLPRVIMRHVLNPSPLIATNSPVGKITGFRIEVNGRRGTRAMRQVMHYGKLATKDSDNSHVDYGRASYYNKKGSTGVRIWIGYSR